MRFLSFVLVVALATLSCVGAGIQRQTEVVRADIDKARKSGAYQCAPKELALAQTSVEFAETELAQGDFIRARAHIEVAVTNANAALANSKECAPKRVLIKTQTDRDGDGVLDNVDACPDQAEDLDLFEDTDGCPELDNDGDKVLEPVDDKCPNTAGPAENGGCPYGDKDNDGVADNVDLCPDAPEDKDGDKDADGRPDIDVDNDGAEDCVQGCPLLGTKDGAGNDVPPPACDTCTQGPPEAILEDKDGFQDLDGCPDVDNDKDGFLDTGDACPMEAGVSWSDQPAWKKANPKGGDGCPPVLTLVVVKKDRIEIKQQVQFDTGKATIKPVSAKLLAEVGSAIRANVDIKKVTIEGHTDDVGSETTNMDLSQSRANSVRQWLIDKEKIDPDLLDAVGFGETQPIASNRTKAGRQQNRRSEFKVERQQ